MIIVKIIGGMGNQMFQYALGRSLAHKNDTILKLDISAYDSYKLWPYSLKYFNILENFATKEEITKLTISTPTLPDILLNKVLKRPFPENPSYISESGHEFQKKILNLRGDVYLDGYWQSEKYFYP